MKVAALNLLANLIYLSSGQNSLFLLCGLGSRSSLFGLFHGFLGHGGDLFDGLVEMRHDELGAVPQFLARLGERHLLIATLRAEDEGVVEILFQRLKRLRNGGLSDLLSLGRFSERGGGGEDQEGAERLSLHIFSSLFVLVCYLLRHQFIR